MRATGSKFGGGIAWRKRLNRKKRPSDLEVLEEIQDKIIDELRNKEINPKVGDLLKALELKMKLQLPEEEKKKIWELIEQLRKEELSSETETSETGIMLLCLLSTATVAYGGEQTGGVGDRRCRQQGERHAAV